MLAGSSEVGGRSATAFRDRIYVVGVFSFGQFARALCRLGCCPIPAIVSH